MVHEGPTLRSYLSGFFEVAVLSFPPEPIAEMLQTQFLPSFYINSSEHDVKELDPQICDTPSAVIIGGP
jgi:hypothetical protein